MNLKGKIERRTATMTTSNNMQVEGYAAVFGKDAMLFESMDTGWKYMERIAPNAFSGTDMSDVVLNYNVENKTYNRIITRIRKLYDVSIVDFPAYESTSVVARSDCGLDIENIEKKLKEEERAPAEQRKRIFILTTF